jgi:hypothetical protein
LAELPLVPHPECQTPDMAIMVAVGRLGDGALALRYRFSGALGEITLPEAAIPARVDGLWESTCCEAFIMAGEGPAYQEHNFAPSGAWASYLLDTHRTGWRWNPDANDPAILVERPSPRILDLHAVIAVPLGHSLRLGLTAVVQSRDGSSSYWALAHPQGRPDFHDAACFTLHVPAGEGL